MIDNDDFFQGLPIKHSHGGRCHVQFKQQDDYGDFSSIHSERDYEYQRQDDDDDNESHVPVPNLRLSYPG